MLFSCGHVHYNLQMEGTKFIFSSHEVVYDNNDHGVSYFILYGNTSSQYFILNVIKW
jgi:hypothetical protein